MVESREQPDAVAVEPPLTEDVKLEPTDAEIEAWAEDERRRRQAWVQGPTPEERAAFARRERERRLADIEGSDAWFAERARTMGLLTRKGQLAAEGAMSLFVSGRATPSTCWWMPAGTGRRSSDGHAGGATSRWTMTPTEAAGTESLVA